MSLRDFPELVRHLPQHKPWVITIGVISVAMVLAVCGFSSWLLLRDESTPIGEPTEGPGAEYRDISTREADSTPMTAADVFPGRDIPAAEPDWPSYTMIGEPHVSEDCSVAADGEVRRALVSRGCSQVIRASFASGDNRHFLTAGIINLPDETVAEELRSAIEGLVASGQGQFLGYISDPEVNRVLYTAPPRLAWRVRGHFLLYTVIVRQDSAELTVEEGDYVEFDILTTYLGRTVLDRWSLVPGTATDPEPPADASPTEG